MAPDPGVTVLSRSEVEALLDLDQLVDALAVAMADLSAGAFTMAPRVAVAAGARGGVAAMLAYLPSQDVLVGKLVAAFHGNRELGLPSHQAVVHSFDPGTGALVALMDGTHLTAARTAAGSALATRLLARPDASVLAVVGTGVQARAHARAIPRVRPIREIRVAGRSVKRAEELADALAAELSVPVWAVASCREAVVGAEIVCTATHSTEPVVRREWLTPGVHVNSVGFNRQGRELDDGTVHDALVVVESRDAALAPFPSGTNDLLWPIRDGVIDPEHVYAEVGELVAGKPGRTSAEQITLYKSVGVGVQDAAAVALVLAAARARGVGTRVTLSA